MQAIQEIIEEIKRNPSKKIGKIKVEVARKYGLKGIPTNSEILAEVKEEDLPVLGPILMRKPVRTISGIAIVAVMARPYPCPGECIYCPVGEDVPQSYTGREPAALRAKRANYDPYLQVIDRLRQLSQIGHPIDKVELIVMGGTFTAQPRRYQEWFIKRCFEAMNTFPTADLGETSTPLKKVQEENERAAVRNVGLTIETRPDFAKEEQVDAILRMGVTRVELGVQTLYDSVYERIKRGHIVRDVVEATRIAKDAGLKVGYHMMPGLFSGFEEDLKIFGRLFKDEGFRPDFLKIYPTLVIKGTYLYELWKRGEFQPYSDEEALELIGEIKKTMPKWVRTMRIQRDIPSSLIEAGVKKSDLGDLVYRRLRKEGLRCRCIRCRDIGHLMYKEGIEMGNKIEIVDEKYEASEGIEHFLSVEDTKNDALIAYLRLRFPSKKAHRQEVREGTALVRELRVLGPMVPIGERAERAEQHRGWGEALLRRAEDISREHGMKNVLITSAVGTREYYRRRGYRRNGPYMGKSI
jgi:elongator complex protein 3